MTECLKPITVRRKLSRVSVNLWKTVRDQGGWWTSSELVRDFGLNTKTVHNSLHNLAQSHYLAQRVDKKTGLLRLGVTAFCRAPAGESLEPGPAPQVWGG